MTQRRILITGITRGLGKHLAIRFLHDGHTVAGCGRSEEALAALRQEYDTSALRTACLDVSSDQAVHDWAHQLKADGFIPDLVINNAAIMNSPRPLWEIPAEEFDRLIDINIKGCASVIRHIVPIMLPEQNGILVNISSGWGRSASAHVAPYCSSKWAIEGLSAALAQELPEGMASVALNPGIINTHMLRECWGDSAAAYPTAEEWAPDAAAYILAIRPTQNGQALTVP